MIPIKMRTVQQCIPGETSSRLGTMSDVAAHINGFVKKHQPPWPEVSESYTLYIQYVFVTMRHTSVSA